MHLKKCAACARAILDSATACQYCGHRDAIAAPPQPAAVSALEEQDRTLEDYFLGSEQLSALPEEQQSLQDEQLSLLPEEQSQGAIAPAEGEQFVLAGADYASVLQDGQAPSHDEPATAAEPETAMAGPTHPLAPVQDAVLPSDQKDPFTFLRDERGPLVQEDELRFLKDEDPLSLDDTPEQGTPAFATSAAPFQHVEAKSVVPPAPAALAATAAKRPARMLLTGAAAAGFLVLAILTMRGAASPGASAGAPAPAAAATPKTAATPRPATVKPQVTDAHARSVPAPTWNRVTDGRWVGRDRRGVALELNATNKVPIWMRQVRPVLVVRCLSGTAEVFVFTQTAAKMEPEDENHTVRVRVDERPESTERWADSMEHDSLFAPDGAALAQQLMQGRILRFGFTPHNAAPVVAEFNVTGLSDLLAPSARQCGWKR